MKALAMQLMVCGSLHAQPARAGKADGAGSGQPGNRQRAAWRTRQNIPPVKRGGQ